MSRPLWFLLLASLPLACTSTEQDPSSGVVFEKGGAGGTANSGGTAGVSGGGQPAGSGQAGATAGSGPAGAAGSGAAGGGNAGSGPAGGGPAGGGPAGGGPAGGGNASGSAGSGPAGGGQAGSGPAGGNAGSGNAGGSAGSGNAGGTAGSGNAGQAGSGPAGGGPAGTAGSGGMPSVHIVAPADGATVTNPVAFSLEASGVDSVGLVADNQYSLPLDGWQVSSASSFDLAYTFSSTGMRSITLSGYRSGVSAPAATDSVMITIPTPPPALCDGVNGASLEPPTSCNGPNGNTSKQIPDNSIFSTSWFGCYRKADGSIVQDASDNCEFACGDKGLCGGKQGPECEADLKWFAADADRFGCGSHIRVTNCANGRVIILTTLDRGPNCGNEMKYGTAVVDMSHDAMIYLFEGKTYGGSDHKRVVIEKVDASVALGPVE